MTTPTDPMQGNEIIARFMGWKYDGIHRTGFFGKKEPCYKPPGYMWYDPSFFPAGLKFDSDWNWLMPVAHKLKTIRTATNPCTTGMVVRNANLNTALMNCEIEQVYQAVLEFINFLNSTPNGTTNE